MRRWAIPLLVVAAIAATATAGGDCPCDGLTVCYDDLNACRTFGPNGTEKASNTCFEDGFPYYECLRQDRLTPDGIIVGSSCYSSDTCEPAEDNANCNCRHDIRCFATLADCRDGSHAVTPHGSNTNADCADIDRPYFSCWETPTLCRVTETCEPTGGGNQDPHFKGFDGSEYYFGGDAGQVYNIVSDVGLSVNAEFIRLQTLKGTYMGRLGLRFGDRTMTFDPAFGLFLEGTILTTASVELPEGSFSVEVLTSGRYRFTFQNGVWMFVASVAVEHGEKQAAYINLETSLLADPVDPHGILGQTARYIVDGTEPNPTKFVVAGVEEDYVVRDGLAGIDFAFSTFGAKANDGPVTITGTRRV